MSLKHFFSKIDSTPETFEDVLNAVLKTSGLKVALVPGVGSEHGDWLGGSLGNLKGDGCVSA